MTSDTERAQSLIDRWADFIRDVARGYTFTMYDYENDLTIRDHLQRTRVELSSESASVLLLQRVEALDDAYRRVTTFVDAPPWKYSRNKSDLSWWWHRIPNKLVGDLAEDFKNL